MIDLHAHTDRSDGSLSPGELVREAKAVGLQAVALTDHDTVAGVEEALKEGGIVGVRVVPGIELSVEWESGPLHILGYFVDHSDRGLLASLAVQQKRRRRRVLAILEKLSTLGAPLSYDEVMAAAPGGVPGKPHLAELMVRRGYASDENQARKEFLDKGGRAYTPKVKLHPEEAIALITAAGGVPVLAHPYSAFRGRTDLFVASVVRFKAAGLRGVEVYYPSHTVEEAAFYRSQAQARNLAITGGSDFHGRRKPEIRLGAVWNGRPLSYHVLTALETHTPRKGTQ